VKICQVVVYVFVEGQLPLLNFQKSKKQAISNRRSIKLHLLIGKIFH
jgi:hypothetical protein